MFSASVASSGTVPPVIYMAVLLFTWLIPYRVLIVWVYEHTQSLLVVMIMHFPLIFDQYVLIPQVLSGAPLMVYLLLFTAGLWVLVVVVMLRRQPRPQPIIGVSPIRIPNKK
jgi:uncharacterized protein